MATGDSRFDPRSSTWMIFAVSAAFAIAVAAFTYQPISDAQGADREVGTAGASPRCLATDRAIVAQLAALLERNGPADALILERGFTHSTSPSDIASTIVAAVRWRITSGCSAG